MEELEAKIKEEERKEQGLDWPQKGDAYYLIDGNGGFICSTYDDDKYDGDRKSFGNMFKTKEEAEFELERLKVIAELKKFARPFVENDMNFILEYYHGASKMALDYFTNKQYGDLHFESETKVQEAIASVGKDRIKKYYFRVVD